MFLMLYNNPFTFSKGNSSRTSVATARLLRSGGRRLELVAMALESLPNKSTTGRPARRCMTCDSHATNNRIRIRSGGVR